MLSGIVPLKKLNERSRWSMSVKRPNSLGSLPCKILLSARGVQVDQLETCGNLANKHTPRKVQ
jgi:hypothetical protein